MSTQKLESILSEATTLIVVFLIYTNLTVLLVKFHGLPYGISVLIPALLLLPLFYQIVVRRQPLILPAGFFWVALFMISLMASTIFAKDFDEAFSVLITYITEGFYFYIVLTNVIRTSQQLRRVIWVLLIVAIIMGGAPLYQQITQTFDNNYGGFAQISDASFGTGEENLQGEVRQPRQAGSVGEMNRFAQVVLMLVPLGLLRFWGEKSLMLRLLALAAAAMAGVGMVLTFSRGAAIAFALMLVLMVVLRVIKPSQMLAFALAGVLLVAAFPQYTQRLVSIQSLGAFFGGDVTTEEESPDGAIRGRITEMWAAAKVYGDHPVFGVGPGMFKYYSRQYSRDIGLRNLMGNREAHSLYLGMAAETGTVGIISFMGMLIATILELLRVRKLSHSRRPDLENLTTSFILVLLAYLTTGLFLHLSYMRYFWIMFALSAAAATIAKNELGEAVPETTEVTVMHRGIA